MSLVSQHDANPWPKLDWADWSRTAETLHMWTQIVGKTRLALDPLQAHWWNVPLYVSARGLSTSAIPCGREGARNRVLISKEPVSFTFAAAMACDTGHALAAAIGRGGVLRGISAKPVAALGVTMKIYPVPVELKDPIPFAEDTQHADYDADSANRFWRILVLARPHFSAIFDWLSRQR